MSRITGIRQLRITSGYRTLYPSSKNLYNLAEVRAALFSPMESKGFASLPSSRGQSKQMAVIDPDSLERQLDTELKEDQRIMAFPKRLKKLEFNKEKANKIIKAEQDVLDTLNQWEIDKIGVAKEEVEYGTKIRNEIEKYVETNADSMLKEDWVKKDSIIRGPAQILYDMLKQGTKKSTGFLSRRPSDNIMDSTRNLPVIQALNLQTMKPSSMTRAQVAAGSSIAQEKAYLRTSVSSKTLTGSERYSREDRKILLHIEINMQLISLCIQRLLNNKKKKQEELRLRNATMLKEVHDLDQAIIFPITKIGLTENGISKQDNCTKPTSQRNALE